MNLDPNISFFQFFCEDVKKCAVINYLSKIIGLKCDYFSDECFTFPNNKKIIPEYLKIFSKDLPGVSFIHTYSFPLANTMGYSVFKSGEIIYHHREGLTDRLTQVSINKIRLNSTHLVFDFTYAHFENPLDFDSKPNIKKFKGKILKELFDKLKSINFQEALKEVLIFNQDDLNRKKVDDLVIEKIYTIINQKDVQTHINYLSLNKSLKNKIEKHIVQKI